MRLSLVVVAGVLALSALPATAQVVESCAYDPMEKEITAVIAPGGEATLQVLGGEIWFGAVPEPCGAATNENTDTIRIAGQPGSGEQLVLDQRTGLFQPGASPDTGLFAEIEIFATLGDATDGVVLFLTEEDDDVAPGVNGIGLTADGDVDVVFTDADGNPVAATFPLEFHALGGNDYVNGRGQFGAGLAYLGALTIDGGAGNEELIRGSWEADVLVGGPGDDVIDGQEQVDILDGGAGSDTLTAGGGNDRLVGGPGADGFAGGDGDDTIVALDGEADTSINGGPGTDTAYYDSDHDPAPLFVENLVVEDTTPPTVSCEAADAVWHADDVTLSCTASDHETGIPDPADQAFTLSTNVPAGTETADAATGTRQVCNGAGLCSTAGPVTGNKVDKKAPGNPTAVHSTDHTVGKWSSDREVSIAFAAAADGGSGVDGISYSWTTAPASDPDAAKDAEETATGITSPSLGNGSWFLHIATVDDVGNWSSADHYGPFRVDGERPRVRALSAAGRAGTQIRLRYRTADNTGLTRERITVLRGGSLVAAWSRPLAAAQWATIQSVLWRPRSRGSYSLCVQARDPAGNIRSDCAQVTVRA